jgi:hypothetical protein
MRDAPTGHDGAKPRPTLLSAPTPWCHRARGRAPDVINFRAGKRSRRYHGRHLFFVTGLTHMQAQRIPTDTLVCLRVSMNYLDKIDSRSIVAPDAFHPFPILSTYLLSLPKRDGTAMHLF